MSSDDSKTRKSTDTSYPVKTHDADKPRKNDLNYVLRSGLAGGLAGCVVSTSSAATQMSLAKHHTPGEDRYSPSRQSEDPFPGLESRLCEVRRYVRCRHRAYAKIDERLGSWTGAFKAGTQIYKENGARGLLQGHSATLIRVRFADHHPSSEAY